MAENSDAEAEATGSDEILTTGDPEQPSGSEEGSQSSDCEEEFQRLEEHVKALERRIAQDREKRRNLFIRFMNLFLDILEAI
ncbi:uncharacterized protein LOC27206333 [Drosophila simulans]|uniref:GD15535 n=1 Tax=Drosophila simulans TaxID=7240 RepID=B4R2Y7_DROSI|nr:uncharacterized protein LOC27206333 [Drosophila simulans]EDX18464.1 GD15535 [Drosophila simulans]KMY87027.1 uncharacterized protein Dsimw501_GD15535 [Drosophila simulans]